MPKNVVTDPLTDQEIAFARLVLSGTMTDRRAAETVGLHPESAASTKAKPRVRAYMLEHRAAVQQQSVQQESEDLPRLPFGRDQILARLWEIANLGPEMTRGSITGQVKALSMIISIEGLIPARLSERRAVSAQKESSPRPAPEIYVSAWLREQQEETAEPQPPPASTQQNGRPEAQPDPARAEDQPPAPTPDSTLDPCESNFANRFDPSQTAFASLPDTRVPFSPKRGIYVRRP